jgi:PAS domain S-box-containing protein
VTLSPPGAAGHPAPAGGRDYETIVGVAERSQSEEKIRVAVEERKDAQKDLAQMESRYRGLLEAAPDAMVVVNQGGEIVLVNVQAEKQFGYRRDELLGKKVTNIIPDGFAERLIADRLRTVEDALAQQIGTGVELIGRRNDGSEFPIEIMLSPFESDEGVLITAAIRNIGTRKNIERLKDEFVATVSHELRTPLTSISGSLGLLMGLWAGKLPESAARLLTIAHANSQRLVRLVNDILDIEKIEFGHVLFKRERVDILVLVEQVIEGCRGFAESYDIRVRIDADTLLSEVNTDPHRLAQVITNLLSNAVKFSPPGEEVVVKVEQSGDHAVGISVRDHGAGVPLDFRPHIFEKFAQADANSARQKGGTGLGLSIAKQIVERLGGELGFDDAPGGGTIFHVILPTRNNLADERIDLKAKVDAPRILVCEDDRDTAIAIRQQLRQVGFAADIAFTAAAAALRADATDYAAILVDLQLPDGDGISVILRLRALARYHDTPVIVVSIDPSRGQYDVRASTLNVLGWLSKPVDFEELILVLRTSIGRDRCVRASILHIDDDPDTLKLVSHELGTMADVISVNSIVAGRNALAGNRVDLAVINIALAAKSGPGLLPEVCDKFGHVVPVIVFSKDASLREGEQLEAALVRSRKSIDSLVATVRNRLAHLPARTSAEFA